MRLALILLPLLGACTATQAPPPAPAPQSARPETPNRDCPLMIVFGSYAMGIDRGAYEAVDSLVSTDGAVTGLDRFRWGREGEVTLCVRTRSSGDTARLFETVKKLFPAKPRGPLTVATLEGRNFSAPSE